MNDIRSTGLERKAVPAKSMKAWITGGSRSVLKKRRYYVYLKTESSKSGESKTSAPKTTGGDSK